MSSMPMSNRRLRTIAEKRQSTTESAIFRSFLAPLLCCTLLLGACDNGEERPAPAIDESEFEGLSRDEIEQQAESMTPEEAERLGIVDSTIRIEAPMNPDSVLPMDSAGFQP